MYSVMMARKRRSSEKRSSDKYEVVSHKIRGQNVSTSKADHATNLR